MTLGALTGMILIAIGTWLPSREPAAAQAAPVSRIVYESCYFDSWDTYSYVCSIAVRADGTETIVAPVGYAPRWSPDGGRIAFVGDMWAADIKVVNLADLTVDTLASDPAFDGAPAWSPDGSMIAFVSDRTGVLELYRVNADGTALMRLTTAMTGSLVDLPGHPMDARLRSLGMWPASRTCIASIPTGPASCALRRARRHREFDWSSDAGASCSTARPTSA